MAATSIPSTTGAASFTSNGAGLPPGPPRRLLQPGSIGTREIADQAVTFDAMSPGVLPDQAGAYVVGQAYALTSQPSGFSLSAVAQANNRSTIYRWRAPRTVTFASLGTYVTTGSAGTNIKLLVYAHDTATGWPGARLWVSGAISTASSSTYVSTSASIPTFTAGTYYWLGMIADGAPTIRCQTTVADTLLGHMATTAATTCAIALLNASDSYASPAATWTFATSQLSAANNPILVATA